MSNPQSITGKEPWLAVILSGIFPGLGQIYAGKTIKGLCLIFIALILIGLSSFLILSPTGSIRLGIQLLIGFSLFYIFSLFDAYRCAVKSNSREFERLRKNEKDPWLAVFLTGLFLGLGHAYQEQWGVVILFFLLL